MKTNVTLPDDLPAGAPAQAGAQGAGPPGGPAAETPEKAIHVDFSKKGQDGSPFQKARSLEKRLKLFLWGDSGVGKTTLSLQFPKPVVIDLEGGADLYGEAFDFDVLRASTADEVMEAVQWLLTHPHAYRTLVIDPITVYWDALQKKWSDVFLRRNKGSKGYKFEFYDLQPRDWMTVKAEFKDLIRKLIALDMNVIVTARQKVQYADGAFMKAIGETFDGEKSLPYLFDTIVRLYRDDKGRFLGECLKDRSNKLPAGAFEVSYARFEELFGKKALARKARPTAFATDEQKRQIRDHIARFGLSPEQVTKRLAAYGAESLDDLTEENARVIVGKFESALAAKGGAVNSGKEA
ncbi:MAG: ATP-binding protein [Armatimonadota bacterium]|nr:ATP-binding protein [Armatimonadota bacterium]MDR7503262.1 ATP-binding protein [Armatimonadota bacterium]